MFEGRNSAKGSPSGVTGQEKAKEDFTIRAVGRSLLWLADDFVRPGGRQGSGLIY
jgi:hypothetical protein